MKSKEDFIDALREQCGIIGLACDAVGISRSTYYSWRRDDEKFREAADEVLESQLDFVENHLLNRIQNGDTTAMLFYLKTKGRSRGYGDKPVEKPQRPELNLPAVHGQSSAIKKRIAGKKGFIIKTLKSEGKYTAELSIQADIVAQLIVRTEMLSDEIFAEGHSSVRVEYSREGNERESIDLKEKLYLESLQQLQRALRGLGMNTEAKERKSAADPLGGFLERFKMEED